MKSENPICGLCGDEIETNSGAMTENGYVHTRCEIKFQESKPKVNTEGFIGRPLTDHKNNKLNRECIEVNTADLRASDGAHHKYEISVFKKPVDQRISCDDSQAVLRVILQFQNGGLKEVGPNGITDQALLAIVLDRLRSFNEGQYRCRENSMMITKIEEALMWGEKRGNDRSRRGVEGERTA